VGDLGAASVLSLARHHPGPLLVPMSLLRPDYLSEVFSALRAGGAEVTHVLLDASDEVLSARIDGDREVPESTTRFRREKLDAYRAARAWLSLSADLVVGTGELSAAQVADRIEQLS
jgi:RNase adaptor protein for sRNA GlmZ degradation